MKAAYPFDQNEIIVQFNAKPGAKEPQIVSHKLRKPTLDELIQREKDSQYELHDLGNVIREVGDGDKAQSALWDKIAIAVQGYTGAKDWHSLTPEDKERFLPGHKQSAIRRMYAADAVISDDVQVGMFGNTWKVDLKIGVNEDPDFLITFTLREPTEKERSRFKASEGSQDQKKGTRRPQYEVKTNLRSYIEFFDALVQDITGGTVDDKEYAAHSDKAAFLAQIDANWKRTVVVRYYRAIEGAIQD